MLFRALAHYRTDSSHTVFSALGLVLAPPPRDLLRERRPSLVSVCAAERFALLTRAAKPAMPFEEEPALDLLATLANAACLMRSGELRRNLLGDGWIWSGVESLSSSALKSGPVSVLMPFLEGPRTGPVPESFRIQEPRTGTAKNRKKTGHNWFRNEYSKTCARWAKLGHGL
jgi:hypothetical protein